MCGARTKSPITDRDINRIMRQLCVAGVQTENPEKVFHCEILFASAALFHAICGFSSSSSRRSDGGGGGFGSYCGAFAVLLLAAVVAPVLILSAIIQILM